MFNDQPGDCDRLRNITFKLICYRNTSCNNIRNICKFQTSYQIQLKSYRRQTFFMTSVQDC
jgi:hypothetical protein